jgi:hypothetical protein
MDVVYYEQVPKESTKKSLFLAGPTVRIPDKLRGVVSWRQEALLILAKLKFEGSVFVPEPMNVSTQSRWTFTDVVEWEEKHLNAATVIMFWVPRCFPELPGFTTNIEFGRWESSGKVVFGAPSSAPKVEYMRYYATKLGIPQATTLEETIQLVLKMIQDKE